MFCVGLTDMPVSVVHSAKDEAAWERAKAIVARQKGGAADRWALVMHVYQSIVGSGKSDKSLFAEMFAKQSAFTGLPGAAVSGKGGGGKFDESKHPRIKGKFAPKGGGSETSGFTQRQSQRLTEAGVPHKINADGKIEVSPGKPKGQANAQPLSPKLPTRTPPGPQYQPYRPFSSPMVSQPPTQQPSRPQAPTQPPSVRRASDVHTPPASRGQQQQAGGVGAVLGTAAREAGRAFLGSLGASVGLT